MEIKEGVHRNQNVLFCHTHSSKKHSLDFKANYPAARWSRVKHAWYLADNPENRALLGLPQKELLHSTEVSLSEVNRVEFVKFRTFLQSQTFSNNTTRTYLGEFAQLLKLLKAIPVYDLTTEQLNSYFLYCIRKLKHSENQVYSRMNAIKSYFTMVAKKPQVVENIIRPKALKKMPDVLTKRELNRLYHQTDNKKHLLLLRLAYGLGLRVSELVELKVADIDLVKLKMAITQPKVKQKRTLSFDNGLKKQIEAYLTQYKPSVYLFEGQNAGKYTSRSVQAVFKKSLDMAGIQKEIGIHGATHSYSSVLMESGISVDLFKELISRKSK